MTESTEASAPPSAGGADRRAYAAVFLIGFVCLAYELVQVRMLSFFLGGISNFLAIPLGLFGLALGSMYCHFVFRGDRGRLTARFSAALFPVLLVTFVLFFAAANHLFPNIHVAVQNPWRDAAKLLTYSAIFLPAYFVMGTLLTCYFAAGAERIGRLYSFDLAGAALGCVATPLLLTTTSLRPTIDAILVGSFLLVLVSAQPKKRLVVGVAAVVLGAVLLLSSTSWFLVERPDPRLLARSLLGGRAKQGAAEVAVRWNHLARTSLLRYPRDDGGPAFVIVQDDGVSNVRVVRWSREAPADPRELHRQLLWKMGLDARSILVMFAGAGRDMVALSWFARPDTTITGVEINPAVVAMVDHPVAARLHMRAFFRQPRVRMVVREGRDYLNHARQKFDFIYVASNGAVEANRTGHARKYLDTYEAMSAYFERLAPDGAILFTTQPVLDHLVAFRKLHEQSGRRDFAKSILAFSSSEDRLLWNLLYRPAGLTRPEVEGARAHVREFPGVKILYDPYRPEVAHEEIRRRLRLPRARWDEELVRDDRPFLRRVSWSSFTLLPSKAQLQNQVFASDWIKVFTVLCFGVVSLLVVAAARFRGERSGRVPGPWLGYFFLTGISYMCVEIGLIAKTELFLGNPLYAVAVILALFLVSNSAGAFLQDRYRVMRGLATMIGLTTAAVAWGVGAVELCNTHLLSLPLALKVLAVAVSVMPAGACLGMYYPYGVAELVRSGRPEAVPMTYGLATLSSVLGSAFAMTAITNIGFTPMIAIGAAGYALASLLRGGRMPAADRNRAIIRR